MSVRQYLQTITAEDVTKAKAQGNDLDAIVDSHISGAKKVLSMLYCEDEELVRELMTELFESCGYEHITTAENGEQAQTYLDNPQTEYDVVFSDNSMGLGPQGTQILTSAHESGLGYGQLFLYSGEPISELRKEIPQEVFALEKPVSVSEIRNIVDPLITDYVREQLKEHILPAYNS